MTSIRKMRKIIFKEFLEDIGKRNEFRISKTSHIKRMWKSETFDYIHIVSVTTNLHLSQINAFRRNKRVWREVRVLFRNL